MTVKELKQAIDGYNESLPVLIVLHVGLSATYHTDINVVREKHEAIDVLGMTVVSQFVELLSGSVAILSV